MERTEKKVAYLTPTEVAELLMVSPITVRHWAQKGTLKALSTPGGHRRFLREEVDRFARSHGLVLSAVDGPNETKGLYRVLIVDDDIQIRRYLMEAIEALPMVEAVETAENGFIAGCKAHEFSPDIIFLDIMMPGINGFEVCRAIKQDKNLEHIRIIAMTAFPSANNQEQIIKAGAELCIAKPFEIEKIFQVLGFNGEKQESRD